MADAVCEITSARMTFYSPKRDYVGETTAMAHCAAGAKLPETETIDGGSDSRNEGYYVEYVTTRTLITYSELVYKWTASSPGDVDKEGQEVDLHFENLDKGEKNTISATVKVTCTKTEQAQLSVVSWALYDDEGNVIDSGWGSGEWADVGDPTVTTGVGEASKETNEVDVWTRPGEFLVEGGGWEMTANHTIQADGGLTSDWTQKWADHMDKIAHWFNQNGTNVAQGCVQQSGAVIYATWYNGCVTLIETYPQESCERVTGGPEGTVITAGVINSLGKANKKTGEV